MFNDLNTNKKSSVYKYYKNKNLSHEQSILIAIVGWSENRNKKKKQNKQ